MIDCSIDPRLVVDVTYLLGFSCMNCWSSLIVRGFMASEPYIT